MLAEAPRFGAEADELHWQHGWFLDQFKTLIAQLNSSDSPMATWQETSGPVESLLEELERHEHREIAIVQSAYDDDLGGGD